MTQEELIKLMQDSAAEAVEIAKSDMDIELDNSEDSLQLVDKVLVQYHLAHAQTAFSDEQIFTICNLFGAYVGEIFKQKIGGEWRMDESDEQAPFVTLGYGVKDYPFPSICYQKLVKDSTISVQKYFKLASDDMTQ